MAAFLDNCRFIAAADGTGDWSFASIAGGCQSPQAAGAKNGARYKFRAETADLTQWEIAEGIYTAASGSFARTTVLYNSLGTGTASGQSGAGARINFTTVPQVAVVGLKEDLLSIEEANSFTPAQQAQALANLGISPNSGRLNFVSATALSFTPYNGAFIRINGGVFVIPPAGIAGLANTGVVVNGAAGQNLVPNIGYYIYAFVNAGVVTADFSTTVHSVDSTPANAGVEVKNGDGTRTLIGMVFTNASAQFSSALVASWFNRRTRTLSSAIGNAGTPGMYFLEVGGGASLNAPGTRCYFLGWADENTVQASAMANVGVAGGSANVGCQMGFNGAVTGPLTIQFMTNNNNNCISAVASAVLGEGLNYAVMFGGNNAASVTYSSYQTTVTGIRG
jgi:hypothetical protein